MFFIKIKIENIGYIFNKNDKRKKKNLIKILELKRIIQLNKKIIFPYQSDLTQNLIEKLLDKKEIDLVRMEDSLQNHKIFLNEFNSFIKKIDSKFKKCPIITL